VQNLHPKDYQTVGRGTLVSAVDSQVFCSSYFFKYESRSEKSNFLLKSPTWRWATHIACMGGVRNAF